MASASARSAFVFSCAVFVIQVLAPYLDCSVFVRESDSNSLSTRLLTMMMFSMVRGSRCNNIRRLPRSKIRNIRGGHFQNLVIRLAREKGDVLRNDHARHVNERMVLNEDFQIVYLL